MWNLEAHKKEYDVLEHLPDHQEGHRSIGKTYHIQVSAKHLIFASTTFRKILTGGWKESFNYLEKGVVEITVDGWDIEALLIFLRVIHCQHRNVPRYLDLEMLAKIAVLEDYYGCEEALSIWTDIWINNHPKNIPTTYSKKSILWLWISWFFKLPDHFREATSIIMSQSSHVFNSQGLPIPERILSRDAIYVL